ncbi:MAG: MBL fold metallo-hydrolase [Promethearchaeota archaeon]
MTPLKIKFLGQSGFLLQQESTNLLIDPRNKKAGNVSGDIVYVTHNHTDHTGGVKSFLKRNPEAKFICNEQVASSFTKWPDRTIIATPGETIVQGEWKLKFIKGRHGLFSSVQNIGIIVQNEDISFGHAGDSVDFQGFGKKHVDVFAVPIGGIFTASPKRVLIELQDFDLPIPTIIPMHWLFRRPRKFCEKLRKSFPESKCVIPEANEFVELDSKKAK